MESSKSKSSIVLNNLSTALLRQLNGIMSSISEFSELVISDKEITLLDSSLYRPFISLLLKSFPLLSESSTTYGSSPFVEIKQYIRWNLHKLI